MKQSFLRRNGITLTEIMMAMALLAAAFIPIIGVMGTSVKATDKDDRTVKAVNICQEKLNRALQFPFGRIAPGTYGGAVAANLTSDDAGTPIDLTLGPETIGGMPVESTLQITDLPGNFEVPTVVDQQKYDNPTNPAAWGWTTKIVPYANMHHQYTLTVRWSDKGRADQKFYTLTSSKANIRR